MRLRTLVSHSTVYLLGSTVQRKKTASPALLHKDNRAVIIDAGRTKAEKSDYAIVKARLQEGLDNV